MHLNEISMWARGRGLEIVLLIVGAILLTRLISWLRDKITGRIDANAQETDALVRSEAAKHRHALAQVITWATIVVIYSATAVLVAERLGIPLTSLVAPAAVVAVALGFGAQRIVQDLLAGFFIITERQYGFGDLVRLSVPSVAGAMGTVEDVTLRVTTVRTADGEVIITPNGQIGQVTNLSRGWARAVLDVPVPATVDVNRVSDLLHQIGEEAYAEPELRQLLLDPPAVMGVQSIDVTQFQVRMVARTLPGKQFDVRPDPAGPGRGRAAAGGHQPACQRGNHRTQRGRLMRRVRTSTWVLLAIFLGTLVLYLWVKPPTPSAAGDSPATGPQTSAPAPAPSHRPQPVPRRTPHRSPTPAVTPSLRRTATPQQTRDAAADGPAHHRAADPRAHPVSVHVCDSLTA